MTAIELLSLWVIGFLLGFTFSAFIRRYDWEKPEQLRGKLPRWFWEKLRGGK